MISISNQIQIGLAQTSLFDLASQVEDYPRFAPHYLHSRIVGFERGDPIVERAARIGGEIKKWKSRAHFSPYDRILFEQCEGPLKGMQAIWEFESLGLAQTHLKITHQILAGLEHEQELKNIFETTLKISTQDFLEHFKKWSEAGPGGAP